MPAKYNDQMLDYLATPTGPIVNSRFPALGRTPTQLRLGGSKLCYWSLFNASLTDLYLHAYDATAASVVPGTTVPAWSAQVKTGLGGSGSFATPIPFATALTIMVSTTVDGSGAVAAGMLVNVGHSAA